MLSLEENQRLTRVGPGTALGNLMRRYWQLVAAAPQLDADPVKQVRLLGESLVLYRDLQGQLGLLAEACPHRGAPLSSGTVVDKGLRCPYHGRLYDAEGRCVEQPLELPGDASIEDTTTVAYPVRELGGLIFAYLGPKPIPLLPRYSVLAWKHVARHTEACLIPCNWLQVMENLMDPMHVECLHRQYFAYVLERQGGPRLQDFLAHYAPVPMKKFGFDLFEDGIIERHVTGTDRDFSWRTGTPTFFPTTSMIGSSPNTGSMIFVVPIDDTHTWFVEHVANRPGLKSASDSNRFYDVPGLDAQGNFITDTANGQDYMAAVTQGDLAQRETERLATSDLGIVLYRQLVAAQVEQVERGHDPINIHRDTANGIIELPSPSQVTAHGSGGASARQQKRARHRQREMLHGSGSSDGEAARDADGRSSPAGHYEVVVRPAAPTAA